MHLRSKAAALIGTGALALGALSFGGTAFAASPPPGSLSDSTSVTVTVSGVVAISAPNPSSIAFGDVEAGTSSSPVTQTFTVTTNDTAGYTLSVGDGTGNNGEFSGTKGGGAGDFIGQQFLSVACTSDASAGACSGAGVAATNFPATGGISLENNATPPAGLDNNDDYTLSWQLAVPAGTEQDTFTANFVVTAEAN